MVVDVLCCRFMHLCGRFVPFCDHLASLRGCFSSFFVAVSRRFVSLLGRSACVVVLEGFLCPFCCCASLFMMILIHILRLCGRCASRSVCFRSFSDFFSVSLYLFCLDCEVVRLCGRFAAGFHLFCGCFESFVVLCFVAVFLHFLCLSFVVVFHLFVAVFCLLEVALYLRLAVLHSSVLSVVVLCFLFFRISYTLLLVAVLSLLAVVLCLVDRFASRLVILLLFEAILHRRRSFCTSFFDHFAVFFASPCSLIDFSNWKS